MRVIPLLSALLFASGAAAEDKARALVEAAIKAHGEGRVAKLRTVRLKAEGTIELAPDQPAVPFTFEDVWRMPDRYRSTYEITVMGRAVTHKRVIDGDRGWVTYGDGVEDMAKAAVAEMREQMYAGDLDRLGFLTDKGVELSPLDEARVAGKLAAGVLVRSKGHRDVKLYFDQATGLLVRREHAVRHPDGGDELAQAVEFGDYADTDGIKYHKSVTVYRGGRTFVSAKVTAVEFLETVDPKLFAKP